MRKIIVAGSRNMNEYVTVHEVMMMIVDWYDLTSDEVTIVSGTARGADTLGEQFAAEYGLPVIRMPAEWDKHGKSAGYKRNTEMAKIADMAIIFWDGKSKGSRHMINIAKDRELKYHVFSFDGEEICRT